jgi:hypothetical protein
MALRISLPEFGSVTSPVTNSASTPRIDAAWFVDFTRFGSTIDIDLSAIINADSFSIAPPSVSVWASGDPASVAGATLLASLSPAATGGLYTGRSTVATVANPGAPQYVLVTSAQGSG